MKKKYTTPVSRPYYVSLQELLENYHTSDGADPGMSAVIRRSVDYEPDEDAPLFKNVSLWDE